MQKRETSSTGGKPVADAPPAVLIVNDQPNSLVALTAAIEAGPWRLVTTNSGLGAFKQLLVDDFAVIVLDVKMPGLDGFEVAEMIRTRPRSASTPIIFCSATERAPDDLFKGFELGAVDYLLAPVAPRTLYSKVAVFVELYEQKRRLARTIAELEQVRATLESQNRELQLAATRDAYTGSLNRRGLVQATAALFDARREGSESSVIALDLDRPGAIVEAHGRAVCDACVRRLARLITAQLRDNDQLSRWRDEQFVIVLGDTPLAAAAEIAERLSQQVRSQASSGLLRDTPGLSLSASIGVVSTALGATTLEALIGQADVAIRAAKEAGGDTVRRYDRLTGDNTTS
jgi:diguanylate cyclase